ncbi:MAG: hypothetical protein DMF06_13830 [Verrucomicrobia bacterium]|nr:MAG: hypothetical protein DMF06_13830 [Verrucomicrobiota bacterium]
MIRFRVFLGTALILSAIVGTLVNAQLTEEEKKKHDARTKAREEMRAVASPAPAETPEPTAKPKPANRKSKSAKSSKAKASPTPEPEDSPKPKSKAKSGKTAEDADDESSSAAGESGSGKKPTPEPTSKPGAKPGTKKSNTTSEETTATPKSKRKKKAASKEAAASTKKSHPKKSPTPEPEESPTPKPSAKKTEGAKEPTPKRTEKAEPAKTPAPPEKAPRTGPEPARTPPPEPAAHPPPVSTLPQAALPADITIEKSGLEKEQGLEPPPSPPPRRGFWPFSKPPANYRYLTSATIDAIRKAPVQRARWKFIIVHNSGTRQGNARAFDYYHRKIRRMKNGLAYHFVIGNGTSSRNGQIEIGDRWRRQINGGHVHSDYMNNIGLGICLVGDFNRDQPTRPQLEACEELIRYLRERCGQSEGRSLIVRPHREVNPPRWATDCPGDAFPYGWFAKFR